VLGGGVKRHSSTNPKIATAIRDLGGDRAREHTRRRGLAAANAGTNR